MVQKNAEGLIVADGPEGMLCDQYLGLVLTDDGGHDGISVGVPGALWVSEEDQYVVLRIGQQGVVFMDREEWEEQDSLHVEIPLSKVADVQRLITRAVEIIQDRIRHPDRVKGLWEQLAATFDEKE